MKHVVFLIAGLSAMAVPAAAITTAKDAQGCQADLAAVQSMLARLGGATLQDSLGPALAQGGAATPTFAEGRCRIESLRLGPENPDRYSRIVEIGPLSWRAEWLDDTRPMPPAALSLDIRQIRPRFVSDGSIGDEFDYMQSLVADLNPSSVRLEFAYDRAAQRAELTRLAWWHGRQNGLDMSVSLTDADLAGILGALGSDVPPLDKLGAISIRAAEVSLTNGGLFESMSVGWLQAIYPALGATPEAAVEAAKRIARDRIATISDDLASAESRAALAGVVDAVPHPLGTLRLKLDAPEGLMPARIAMTAMMVEQPDWDSFAGILAGVRLDAEWTPAPPPEDEPLPAN